MSEEFAGAPVGAVSVTTAPATAVQIAQALNKPLPTMEQQAVIEAPLEPVLVVAGAGSGKTETMANRVLWLLANGLVRPDQILGLTFTRKAAGELASRINDRISQLDDAGLIRRPVEVHSPAGMHSPADVHNPINSTPDAADLFDRPTVSTYNAFSSRLFSDNALLLGREPESVLLSETSAWLLARRVVIEYGDRRLVPYGKKLEAVTDAVLELSRNLAENPPPHRAGEVASGHDLAGLAESFQYLEGLPYGRAGKSTAYASVIDSIAAIAPLPVLGELAGRYQEEKRRLGLIEFSDQVALALQVCRTIPSVAARSREQYRVVLLDEYQDTSVLQTELLATLFAQHPVMAVGDPHQSIYGWRGASAANLLGFASAFGGGDGGGDRGGVEAGSQAGSNDVSAVEAMSLSYTWRNPVTVLSAANTLVSPLSDALRARPNGIQVDTLKVPEGAAPGRVEGEMLETIADEAARIARWFAERLPEGTERTGAMLFRARRDMDFYAEVLREHGVRAHVLGIGGLLSTPEIADLVSVLRVVNDPSAGTELIRVLTGGRWRIGPRDLKALSGVARWLVSHDWAQKAVSDEMKARITASVAEEDSSSLVDALDFVSTAPEGHTQLAGFSHEGRVRLRDAGRQFAWFRSRAGLGLLDFVRLIEQELLLDVELVANESRGLGLANLYSFHDNIEAFLRSDELGTLGSFLRWLKRAEAWDDMGPRTEMSEHGTVQLLTIHGAKGLEWDYVAIPALTENSLPAQAKEGSGWLRFGELPYPFRGDRDELPALRWKHHSTQAEYDEEFTGYKTQLKARHEAEERRLIYVATTRAQRELLLTGSFWAAGKRQRKPSRYLAELAAAGLIDPLPEKSATDDKPDIVGDGTEVWPFDPLGTRRRRVENAAALVEAAAAASVENGADAETRWSREVTLLLAERALRLAGASITALPTRIPASRFKDYVDDPIGAASALRRPMPQRPYRATRLGTLFHSWVEQRAGGASSGDLVDAGLAEFDFDIAGIGEDRLDGGGIDESGEVRGTDDPETVQFERLKSTFERSAWGALKPEEVEIEIHHVLAGAVFVCKLDAVYRTPTGYQVVDWKTGKAPKNAADLELKQTQLALYRLAYARWKGIDPETVDAVFYFVADDTVVAPERLYSEEELVSAWSAVRESAGRDLAGRGSAALVPRAGATGVITPVSANSDSLNSETS